MADVAAARDWLTQSLTSPNRYDNNSSYYSGLFDFITALPDDDAELARIVALLRTYDRGPDRWPDISLNGDDEDTAEAIGEVLDEDAMSRDTGGDEMAAAGNRIQLSRESYAAFLHSLVDETTSWLISDAEIDRFAE
jgi:hypothetical protein